MPATDKRIDAYIAKAPDFARPILARVRELVHEACPDCEETLKWGHPSFLHNGIVCGMMAHKAHCGVHFWKGSLVRGGSETGDAWERLSSLRSVAELPSKRTFTAWVKKAVALNDLGVKAPKRPTKPKPEIVVPGDFMAAVRKNKRALATFEAFSPSARREYVEWITSAKADETRARRLAQAVEWMAEGKKRNWKYM